MIKLESIQKSFDNNVLFKNINLQIAAGKKIAITGRSGCGKTTLLNILGLLESADQGNIYYNDELQTPCCYKTRNENIGFVFQFHLLDPELSVFENLKLPRLIRQERFSEIEALELLKKVDLSEKLHVRAKFLSGGQKQRIAFLRALVNSPQIILADEPTGQLDQSQGMQLMEWMLQLEQSVVLVTHDKGFASLFEIRYELTKDGLIPW